jgi:transketolase
LARIHRRAQHLQKAHHRLDEQLFLAAIGWPHEPFVIPEAAYAAWDGKRAGDLAEAKWTKVFASYKAKHPELADNVGNIALLQRAEKACLLPAGVGEAAANAYRELRRVQHHARLNEEPTDVAPSDLQRESEAVLGLWRVVMG